VSAARAIFVRQCAPRSAILDGQIMSRLDKKQSWGLAIGGILLTLLLAAVFTFGSLTVPFEPKSWRAVMVLYAVSSFITALFSSLVLSLREPFCGFGRNGDVNNSGRDSRRKWLSARWRFLCCQSSSCLS